MTPLMQIDQRMNHITRILSKQSRLSSREDVFIALLLTYYSPLNINLEGKRIRGYLDVLLFGESRCTKTAPTLFLYNALQRGSYSDGKNTYAGLVGGIDKVGNNNVVKAGVFPNSHRRIVIIDEANDISPEVFSMLSGIRSRGVAKINAIQSIERPAECRKFWIANPRGIKDGTIIRLNNRGEPVNLVKYLIPNLEDLNRFDLILAFEEAPEECAQKARLSDDEAISISQEFKVLTDELKVLLRFVWTRTSKEVILTKETTDLCFKMSLELSKKYKSDFPGVLGAEQPDRIARLASAVAGLIPIRTKEDNDNDKIVVLPVHVEWTVNWLIYLFNKNPLQYGEYARRYQRRRNVLISNRDKILNNLQKLSPQILRYLYTHSLFTHDNFRKDNPKFNKTDELFSWLLHIGLIHRNKAGFMKDEFLNLLLSKEFNDIIGEITIPDLNLSEEGIF